MCGQLAGSPHQDSFAADPSIAVRRLDELGALLLRGVVEDIAQLMGVSRLTLYRYLKAIRPKD
jgi:predicted transcriptional regulator YheO